MPIVDGHIVCSRCGISKPTREFQPSVVRRGCGACRVCKYDDKRAYERRNPKKAAAARRFHRRRNPERASEVRRAHYRANPEAYRGYALGRYGLTVAGYDTLLAAQGGRCACCGTRANMDGRRLFVDHDHATGAVRGLLCNACNRGIGALGDNVAGVRRALEYLERTAQQPQVRAIPAIRINLLQGAN